MRRQLALLTLLLACKPSALTEAERAIERKDYTAAKAALLTADLRNADVHMLHARIALRQHRASAAEDSFARAALLDSSIKPAAAKAYLAAIADAPTPGAGTTYLGAIKKLDPKVAAEAHAALLKRAEIWVGFQESYDMGDFLDSIEGAPADVIRVAEMGLEHHRRKGQLGAARRYAQSVARVDKKRGAALMREIGLAQTGSEAHLTMTLAVREDPDLEKDDDVAWVIHENSPYTYLARFPDGKHAEAARARIAPAVETEPFSGGALRVGGDVTAPIVIERREPQYPEVARKARISGIVIVEVIIDQSGAVTAARVLKPLPFGLDEEALRAVKAWRFRPGRRNGQPVATIFNLTVSFKLDE